MEINAHRLFPQALDYSIRKPGKSLVVLTEMGHDSLNGGRILKNGLKVEFSKMQASA